MATIISMLSCIAIFRAAYRSYRSPFFLCMLLSVAALGCAAALSLCDCPMAGALSDFMLILSGAAMMAASWQLAFSFRLAGDADA